MSHNLPSHPNLDHLKKQAKELLQDLKHSNPALKLADAQHALAREYGFASWPKLKVYVETLTGGHQDRPGTTSPFAGTWTANLSKSRRHPQNQFQRATLQFAVSGDIVTITDAIVDASGREEHNQNTIVADGHEHPAENGSGYALIARWRSSRILETVANKDGQPAGWGRYEVSDDGMTLTISGDEQVVVFDRN